MKKAILFVLTVFCVLSLFACKSEDNLSNPTSDSEESTQNTGSSDNVPENRSEQDIVSMFNSVKDAEWEMIGCAVIPDHAYDLVGAVLYRDSEEKTVNVAFFKADGAFQRCGAHLKTAPGPEFSYLGNGTVTYKFETADGAVYNYKLTISIDGSNVHFVAEDDTLRNQ